MGERPLSDFAVYRARPTVQVNGTEQIMLSELIVAMTMTESEGGMSALELKVSNFASNAQGGAGLAFEDERIVKLGSQIALGSGDQNKPREIFQGIVTGLEAEFSQSAPPELTILAEDAFQRARMNRRTKLYRDVSVADIAREIAQELGVTPVISGFTSQVGTWVQRNESDLAFLRRLLGRYDGDVQTVGNELQVAPKNEVRRNEIELKLYGQLIHLRVLADLAGQATEATAAGWDAEKGERTSATSQGVNLGPGRGRTGAQILEEALGERSEHIGHLAATTSEEATELANAMFDQRARAFVRLEGTVEGNPSLRIGTHVNITGVSARFDNTYYVTRACHRYNLREGYRTTFNAECAYLGAAG